MASNLLTTSALLAASSLGVFASFVGFKASLEKYKMSQSPLALRELCDALMSECQIPGLTYGKPKNNVISGSAVIFGPIQSSKPLFDPQDSKKKYILLGTKKIPRFQNIEIYQEHRPIPNIKSYKPGIAENLVLGDPVSTKLSVSLPKPSVNRWLIPPECVKQTTKEKFEKIGILSRIGDWCETLLDFLTFGIIGFAGAKIGYSDSRIALEVNSSLFVLADFKWDIGKKSLSISKTESISVSTQTIYREAIVGMALAIILASVSLIGTKRCLRHLLAKLKERMKGKPVKQIDQADEKTQTQSMQCIICYENRKMILLEPCLHLVLCKTCGSRYKDKRCPVCKKGISTRRAIVYPEISHP